MADWFAKLMQRGHARGRAEDGERKLQPRDARYDTVVQMLRDREAEDRDEREKRHRWYRQSLESDPDTGGAESSSDLPVRLYRFGTKVPCRVTPEASGLLEQLRRRFSGCTVSFQQATNGRQPVILTAAAGTERKQVGWIEHCVEKNPTLCHARNHGLSVETDGESMLVMRFRYPSTAVRMSARQPTGDVASVNFTEIRPALDQRPNEKSSSPRLVWLTRPELDAMKALESRDYEAFYVRFKLELQAAIWSTLSALLSSAPGSRWHRGSCYTVVTEPDAAMRKIHQRTVDDSSRSVDIGFDRVYDAAPATDILLLFLDGDILADLADIYFTLQDLGSSDAYFLKEEFFTVIRRFWANSQSLASRYGSELATVVRMSQRAMPMPAQAPLLKQDWTNLRQSLVDRYGKGGRNAADLVGEHVYRPVVGPLAWPFSAFPVGEVNLGLRFVYRQEWRHLGTQRGEVLRTSPETPCIPLSTPRARSLDELVDDVGQATIDAMKWPRDFDGSVHTGVRGLAVVSEKGIESESRESSRDITTRLTDIACRLATALETPDAEPETETGCHPELSCPVPSSTSADVSYVYTKLQNRYEVVTRPAEIQNVVLVAEKLPAPAEIDLSWARRHDWILAKALLDESFRDALDTIGEEVLVSGELQSKRNRFCEHLRANILHYQRAIWRQEDPQQRSMRYRKSGKKVPLEWRFELEIGGGGALTIDELGDRLSATNVDGQFAAYSGGREADLDQVIDPAGPIGYYGNYAVYQMRPEFGSDDFFSMLHFFKSPYLRPSCETGMPEVDDPVQIQLAEDPASAAASDQLIDRRSRRFALDTGGVVIDVIRESDSEPDGSEDNACSLTAALEGCELILEGESNRICVSVPDDGEWIDDEALSSMRAVRLGDSEAESWIVPEGDRTLGGGVIEPNDSDTEAVIFAHGDDAERSPTVGQHRANDPQGQPGIAAEPGREPEGSLVAGRAHESAQCLIVTRDGGMLRLAAASRPQVARNAQPESPVPPLPSADVPDVQEPPAVILPRGGEHTLGLAGSVAKEKDTGAASLILAGNNEERSLRIGSGRALELKAESGILAPAEGESPPALLAGRAHDSDGQAGIHVLDEEALRLTAVDGGKAAHPHEKAILAGGDDEWIASLLAGSGVDRIYERVILAQEDEWLRPSLVAG